MAALLDGALDDPPWATFLNRLREVTGAQFATLIFQPPERPVEEWQHFFSGEASKLAVDSVYCDCCGTHPLSQLHLDEGRVYGFEELCPSTRTGRADAFHGDNIIVPGGFTACRMMRVVEPGGVAAWLSISHRSRDFAPADTALMHALGPVLRGVLRLYVELERTHFTASVTGDALQLLSFGWMALDAQGYLLDYDPEAGKILMQSGVLGKSSNGRLFAKPTSLAQMIFDSLNKIARDPKTKPVALVLSHEPWLDMLLLPATDHRLSVHPRAVAIGYVHGDSWLTGDRCDQLIQLFGLSHGEARLALALSRGMSLEEAAVALNIAVGTSRKRSKAIYAKLKARGLPDLIRIVMRSVLAVASRD